VRIVVTAVLLSLISIITQAQDAAKALSPQLEGVQNRVLAGDNTAVDAFWNQVTREGAPLIEPDVAGSDLLLVTFVYRGTETTRNVAIGGFIVGWEPEERFIKDQAMARLGDTNIWYKTFKVRSDARVSYLISENEALLDNPRAKDVPRGNWRVDSLNPHRFFFAHDAEGPKLGVSEVSYVELPAAPSLRWSKMRPGTPTGRVDLLRFKSTAHGNSRRIWIYTPLNFERKRGSYDLLLLFDGWEYTHWIPTPTILNNLIFESAIRPIVAVMIESTDRGRELTGSSQFVTFLSEELVPFLRKNYAATSDPTRTVGGGASLGGLAAAYAALRKPQVFGNVLSQSGSYWWGSAPDQKPEEIVREFQSSSRVPVRFYVEVGLLEDYQGSDKPTQLKANRDFRDALTQKGYNLKYDEFNGAMSSSIGRPRFLRRSQLRAWCRRTCRHWLGKR